MCSVANNRDRENSFGGFQYRWNYDEYQKSLQRKRKKSAARGMRAFCLTTVFVFLLCTASLLVVLTASLLRGVIDTLPDTQSGESSGISLPLTDGQPDTNPPAAPDTRELPTEQLPENAPPPPVIDGADVHAAAENENDGQPAAEQTPPEQYKEAVTEDAVLSETDSNFAELTISEIADTCSASTVTIQCKNSETQSIGSGFFLSEDGYIVTNNHVIRRYDAYQVLLSDGTAYEAELIFAEPASDLALLKIDVTDMPVVSIGTAEHSAIGDQVVAIGTPGSVSFAGTVTYGYISGLDRRVEITDSKDAVIGHMEMIQFTAVINPGNSGGPLFNCFGEVIGISTMKLTGEGFEGMGFAIPIDTVYPTLREQIESHRAQTAPIDTEVPVDGETAESDPALTPEQTESAEAGEIILDTRPPAVLGIRVETVTEKEALLYKMPVGVIIRYVEPGTDAEQCGLRTGDIILSIDGSPTTDVAALDAYLADIRVGDTVQITVFRADAECVIPVTFTEPQQTAEEPADAA